MFYSPKQCRAHLTRRGLSLLELLVVMAIMATLSGVAVNYYGDTISDNRRNLVKSNLNTLRSVINQFTGDQKRGPLRVNSVATSAAVVNVGFYNNSTSELVAGPIQFLQGATSEWKRRTNVQYLPAMPIAEDPVDGSRRSFLIATAAMTFYVDIDGDDVWDINTELAWQPLNLLAYNASLSLGLPVRFASEDTPLVVPSSGITNKNDFVGSSSKPLDITEVIYVSSDGTVY